MGGKYFNIKVFILGGVGEVNFNIKMIFLGGVWEG